MFVAGEDCRRETRGMFLVTTNSISPFAVGRWTDSFGGDNNLTKMAFTRTDPLQRHIDPWGKVEGHFNNLDHFPTPYSQDPNGVDWPYFDRLSEDSLNIDAVNADILAPSIQQSDSNLLQKLKKTLTFSQDYKYDLTKGFIDENVFSVPEVILSN